MYLQEKREGGGEEIVDASVDKEKFLLYLLVHENLHLFSLYMLLYDWELTSTKRAHQHSKQMRTNPETASLLNDSDVSQTKWKQLERDSSRSI